MMKAKILNKTVTTTLILLLTLSMLGVINIAFVGANPDLILTPNSGKVKTTFKVAGTGFGDTKKVGIGFGAEDAVIGESVTITVVSGTNYTGTLSKKPIKPTSVTIKVTDTAAPPVVHTLVDTDGDGKLKEATVNKGVINYVTRVFWVDVGFALNTGAGVTTADYTTYKYDVTPTSVPTTNSTGYFEATCEVPHTAIGSYTVTAIDETGHLDTGIFTVVKGITLDPSKGTAGTSVTVYGSGFTPSGTVDIYFDKNGNGIYEAGERWIPDQSIDEDGKFKTAATATPVVTAGYRDYAVYATGGGVSAIAYFTVSAPEISISPDKGTAATPLTVKINYFNKTLGAGDVQIFFDTNNNEVPDAGDNIVFFARDSLNNTGGNDAGTSITVPESVGFGDYGVIAKNTIGETASTTFTVKEPVIAISPTEGIAGVNIAVSINYYNKTADAAPTYVFFDTNGNGKYDTGENKQTTPGDFSLNETGGAPITLAVPTVVEGVYRVYANNTLGQAVYATYTVKAPVIVITAYPKGVPGTDVTVKINYFSKAYDVKIGYDINKDGDIQDTGEVVATVDKSALNATGGTDADVTVTAPDALGYGNYVINATNTIAGGAQSATTTFTVMQPVLEIMPEKGTAATPVTVNVYWFNKTTNAGDINVWIDVDADGVIDSPGEVVATITRTDLDYTGNKTLVGGTIPSGIGFGAWTVNASNNVQYTTDTFTVMEPVIAISPDKGTAGTTIYAPINYYNKTDGAAPTYVFFDTNGNGKWDTDEPEVVLSSGNLNATGGNATLVSLLVPEGVSYGDYKVYANNTLGQVRYQNFTVMEPVMLIGPTSGATGTTVTVEINYFNKTAGAGTTYTFFDSNKDGVWDLGEPKITWSLDNTGGGIDTLTVPTVDPSVYKIYTKNNIQSAYKEFEIVSKEISLLEEIKAMLNNTEYGLQAIKNAVGDVLNYLTNTINPKLDAINSTVTTIQGILNNADYGLAAIKSYLTDTIYFMIDEVEPLLKNPDYGLEAIKTAVDNVYSEVTNSTYGLAAIKDAISDIDAKINLLVVDANENGVPDFIEEIDHIEDKLDALPAWGTLVTKNWTDLTGYIDSAKTDIIAAMPELDLSPVLNELGNETYGLVAIKNAVDAIKLETDAINWTDIATIKGYVQVINWTDIAAIKTYVSVINWTDIDAIKGKTFEMWADITDSTHGLVAIKNAVDAINFTAIDNKLGAYNPGDTVASLLYDIKIAVSAINWADVQAILSKVTNIENEIYLAPSELKFDFGTATSLWEHDYIQVTETTAYSADTGYGWTNTTGLYSRDRGAPDYTRRDFVFSPLNRTFQVDLPNGNYTVIITMGDQNYAHDNMQIYAEGTFKANVTTPAATYKQIVFTVTVTDGSLELTFVDAGGVDVNWVINSLIIQRNWK